MIWPWSVGVLDVPSSSGKDYLQEERFALALDSYRITHFLLETFVVHTGEISEGDIGEIREFADRAMVDALVLHGEGDWKALVSIAKELNVKTYSFDHRSCKRMTLVSEG